jgi:hypothetical protein
MKCDCECHSGKNIMHYDACCVECPRCGEDRIVSLIMHVCHDQFRCAKCLHVFGRIKAEEEVEAEYQEQWPTSAVHGEPRTEVCDDCYKVMTRAKSPQQAEKEHYGGGDA